MKETNTRTDDGKTLTKECKDGLIKGLTHIDVVKAGRNTISSMSHMISKCLCSVILSLS